MVLTSFNKNLLIRSNYLLIQKFAKEGKRCSRCLAVQKVAENAKSCSQVAEHNLFMPSLSPVPSVHSRDRQGLLGPKVDVITRSSGVKNNPVWQTGQEAGHRKYHVNENERIYGQADYPT